MSPSAVQAAFGEAGSSGPTANDVMKAFADAQEEGGGGRGGGARKAVEKLSDEELLRQLEEEEAKARGGGGGGGRRHAGGQGGGGGWGRADVARVRLASGAEVARVRSCPVLMTFARACPLLTGSTMRSLSYVRY